MMDPDDDDQLAFDLDRFPVGSVYADWLSDALLHKWLESEKALCDLGESAIREWLKKYWDPFVRSRLMQHLDGRRFWSEFDGRYFGLFRRLAKMDPILVDRISDRLRIGGENLCVICWATEWGIPMSRVDRILGEINLNLHRLEFPRDPNTRSPA